MRWSAPRAASVIPAGVTMVFHKRSITRLAHTETAALRRLQPFVRLEVYMSQPSRARSAASFQRRARRPLPSSPSNAPAAEFLGRQNHAVTVVMWLKNSTRVRGVIASLKRFNTAAALVPASGA